MRFAVIAVSLALGTVTAAAQPVDPYPPPAPTGPAPADPYAAPAPPAPVDADAEIDEAVAAALLDRARVLRADGAYGDAKQLVVEAMARQHRGPTYDQAKLLLAELNALLGIVDRPPAAISEPVAPPPPLSIAPGDLAEPPAVAVAVGRGDRTLAAYGVVAGAALGVGLVGLDEVGPAVGLAVAGGVAGGVVGGYLARRQGYDRTASHLIGSGVAWGAVVGGMFADVVSGLDDTTAGDVAVGVGLGAVGGAVVGAVLRRGDLTGGDAALINSVAGWGTEAALAFAVAIAPPETEAYTLNGALGAAGGYLIGHLAARSREVSAARLAKVNGIAAIGAAAPWLLYALVKDDSVDDDEQAFGWLSMAGLGAGIYFGFQWTSEPGSAAAALDDAPAGVVRRSSVGGWSMGGPALAPVRTPGRRGAVTDGRGVAVTVVSGAW